MITNEVKWSWQQLLIVTVILCCKWQMCFRKYVCWTDLLVGENYFPNFPWKMFHDVYHSLFLLWGSVILLNAIRANERVKYYNVVSLLNYCCFSHYNWISEAFFFCIHFYANRNQSNVIFSGMALYFVRPDSIILGT